MSRVEVVMRDVTVRGILVMVRCDAHIGEQYPPRCSECTALIYTAKTPAVPLAPLPVPVWFKIEEPC
jgi:hypothetical protein